LGAGVALLLGLGRVRGDEENAAAPPASALGPVHAVRITVLSNMLTYAVGVGEWSQISDWLMKIIVGVSLVNAQTAYN
jgi:hypothetical protein